MNKHSSSETNNKSTEPPAPEVLKPQSDNETFDSKPTPLSDTIRKNLKPRHGIYRPSHKATFIGLAVVVAILLVNAGVIYILMNIQSKNDSEISIGGVKISPAVLDTLGVSRNTVGNTGSELVVNPNARFNGKVTVGGDITIAGELKLNSKLNASNASLAKLQAGDTSLETLNVNGDATVSSLVLRKNLTVAGATQLQGPLTVNQLLTVNNNMNVSGNLAVGGTLSMGSFQTNIITIGGHIITNGSAPGVSRGSALGATDTISISGNDVSGTVAVNIGTSNANGILANVSFVNQYGNIPHVVVTAIGRIAGSVYVNRSSGGFSIGVNGSLSPGGYAFDYIVMQ